MEKRPELTFHRTFFLNRPAIAQVLALAMEESLSVTSIREKTTLGSVYAEAIPRYGRASGLIEGNTLSGLGRIVFEHDPYLTSPTTMWLMHYHMSAPLGPGPEFWSRLVRDELRAGRVVTNDTLGRSIALTSTNRGRSFTDRAIRQSATVFLGTYTKSEALGPLCILEVSAAAKAEYSVKLPLPPPASVFAYALAHHWSLAWPTSLTADLETVMRDVAEVFVLSRPRAMTLLEELQSRRLVDLHLQAPPFQALRLWQDMAALGDHLYG